MSEVVIEFSASATVQGASLKDVAFTLDVMRKMGVPESATVQSTGAFVRANWQVDSVQLRRSSPIHDPSQGGTES